MTQPAIIARPMGRRRVTPQRLRRLRGDDQGRVRAPHRRRIRLHQRRGARLIWSIYAYRTQTLGWSDIGYNFLVDRFGRLFEGRWGDLDRPVIGAHTGSFNTNTVGVAAWATTRTSAVPAAVMTGFGQLLGWKLGPARVDPYGRVTLTSGGGDSATRPARRSSSTSSPATATPATPCAPASTCTRGCPRFGQEARRLHRPARPPAGRDAIAGTRHASGSGPPPAAIPAGSSRSLQVAGRGGVPASGIGTVVLNLTTAVKPSRGGYLYVYLRAARAQRPQPQLPCQDVVANLVHVAVGSGEAVAIYAGGADVHVVADVYGWTSNAGASLPSGEGLLQPVGPLSRPRHPGRPSPSALVNPLRQVGGTGGAAGVPAGGVSAAIVNLTVTRPTASSFLTVYPGGQPPLDLEPQFPGRRDSRQPRHRPGRTRRHHHHL